VNERIDAARPLIGAALVGFLPSDDLERARRFFVEVIGLTLVEHDEFACIFDVNGTELRVTLVQPFARPPHTVLGWRVDDIVATVGALTARGVGFDRHEGLTQDELGIWDAPSGYRVAWFKDPDGNTLSLSQPLTGP
jgi:catechol 2,3-dioxygenase-like lactoylglutathione lyase family enzyme